LVGLHRERKQHYIAAPVFGRPEAASAGKLFIVAAGQAEQISRCQGLFKAMGKETFVAGEDQPVANVIKLTGNFLITTAIESLAEAFALVRKSNVDPQKFLKIMTSTLFGAPVFENYGSMIAKGQFEPAGFKLPLGFKDNRLILALAEETAAPMPMASLIHDRFLAAMAQDIGDEDWSAIARISFQSAGLEKAA
jgi:3-hydroxyisobutyrate dehydrogenase-like beta-hydroxyacid dehydrogenase